MGMFSNKTFNNSIKLKKKPKLTLIVDNFGSLLDGETARLKNKYNLDKVVNINDLKEFEYPDLIILLSNTFQFSLKDPLVLYKTEICYYRKKFNEKVFYNSLQHYSECQINNGK